ncbi:hypothetical protein [Bosea sp. RAC05]|uniref:hypothetical protein n=1 Tax=Bosea sp. RAC05 TaxID=1842539 RepID=UPI000857F05D|nr:hypothetical protein [Bosea sp. RAC05]AOG03009.1 hypothetical protein BSY19_4824 [Bosea sp. RAC05]
MTDTSQISSSHAEAAEEGSRQAVNPRLPGGRPMPQFGGVALLRSARASNDPPHRWAAMMPAAPRAIASDVDTSADRAVRQSPAVSDVDTKAKAITRPPRPVPPKKGERVDVDTGAKSKVGSKELSELPEDLSQVEAMPSPGRTPMRSMRLGKNIAVAPTPSVIEEIRQAVKAGMEAKVFANRIDHIDGTPNKPTRTAATAAAYLKRGQDLIKRFRRERGIEFDVESFDPVDFATWCIGLRYTLKPSTWRQYRQSILAALHPLATEKAEQAIDMIEYSDPNEAEMMATAKRSKKAQVVTTDRAKKTSSQKRKEFPHPDYLIVVNYLRLHRRSETSYFLSDWIDAGLMTGLRPSEWKTTEYKEFPPAPGETFKRAYLFVINAKATNGRGNGLARTLDLTGLSDGKRAIIERMSRRGREWHAAGQFDLNFSKCSQMLYDIGEKKLWSKRKYHFALYSCRHQFIANQHARGLSRPEISAMVGHIVDETVSTSYAKKPSGWSVDLVESVRGVPEEIASVRRILVNVEERMKQLKISKRDFSTPEGEDVQLVSGEDLVAEDPGR